MYKHQSSIKSDTISNERNWGNCVLAKFSHTSISQSHLCLTTSCFSDCTCNIEIMEYQRSKVEYSPDRKTKHLSSEKTF